MDQVSVLRVVIASPGDVKPEREAIPRVVEEVNRNIARPRGLRLDVYRWETDTYPGFHPEGPQGLIDPALKIDDCDILIGIFWKRFGTPVSDAKSGTEHEFRIAYEAWRKCRKPQIMVYFSQKKYMPKSKEDTDQWGLVLRFKKDFPPEGLWWDYKDKAEFEQFTRNHLTNFLSEQFPIDKALPDPAALTSRFQVPHPPADFTGREAELRDLRAALEQGGVYISGLQGQGGVGKTALALKLAAEIAPNFPDGKIYLDLKGVGEKPLTAAEALSHVLRAFHPEAKLPEKEDDLCGLFRSVLHDKHVLLLMDNAKDATQVKSLIPPEGNTLLVTSRTRFTLPGLYRRSLDTLPTEDAKKLLLKIAPRISGEAEAIAKLCGCLALALRLAATAIAEHIDLDPAEYRQKLTDENQRLQLLGGDEDEGVTASITLSYNLLDEETQKHWRLLSVFPDTFDIPATAAVWQIENGATADQAKATLSRLVRYSMLEWDDSAKRYHLHDLMRYFARHRTEANESDAAARRHARHYLAVVRSASDLYLKGGDSLKRGLALFDLEWGNIQTGQAWAMAHAPENNDDAKLCNDYPDLARNLLLWRLPPREQIRWFEAALASARQLIDRKMEGLHLGNLGNAYYLLGDHSRAIFYHECHLATAREIKDKIDERAALNGLGNAYSSKGEAIRAIENYEQSLLIVREIGEARGEGMLLVNLGHCHQSLGEANRAIENYEQSLVINRNIGDPQIECNALDGLGGAYTDLGDYHRAIEYFKRSLAFAREIGDQRGRGTTLWFMSLALDKLGERKMAIEHAEAALEIFAEQANPTAAKAKKQLEEWRKA
jgi:tetratricopeptide (TPR) repeat protein